MPRRSGVSGRPRDYMARGSWPHGELVPGAPVAAHYARWISARLEQLLQGRSQTEVASRADLARSTVNDIVAGRTWPDIVSLSKLEGVLGARLWPDFQR